MGSTAWKEPRYLFLRQVTIANKVISSSEKAQRPLLIFKALSTLLKSIDFSGEIIQLALNEKADLFLEGGSP